MDEKRRLKDINRQLETLNRKMRYIEKSLMKENALPVQSLQTLTKIRQKYLKSYNDIVKSKNKTNIEHAQKILHDIVRMETIANKIQKLKLLTNEKHQVMDQKVVLQTKLYQKQQATKNKRKIQDYWEFDF